MDRRPGRRWEVTGFPAEAEHKKGRMFMPALPPRVRLHLLPGGIPLEVVAPAVLRDLAADLERAAVWLEGQEPETPL